MRLEWHPYGNTINPLVLVVTLLLEISLTSACRCPECVIRQPSMENEDSVWQALLGDKCTSETCGQNGAWLGENLAFRELDLDTQYCTESPALTNCTRDLWVMGLEQNG